MLRKSQIKTGEYTSYAYKWIAIANSGPIDNDKSNYNKRSEGNKTFGERLTNEITNLRS